MDRAEINMPGEKFRQYGKWILWILYGIITLTLIFYHENWQDELHAWVMARELSFTQIIHAMRYDGHFALWHFLLRPFAGSSFPLVTLNLLSFLLCFSAAGIFIFYGRLSLWVKFFVLGSCACMYYFPVVARPYAMLGLVLCMNCSLYPVRFKRPVLYACSILLILYIHSYLAGLAGILGLLFILECRKHFRRYPGRKRYCSVLVFLILFCGALCAFLMVFPCVGASSVVPGTFAELFRKDLGGGVWRCVSGGIFRFHALELMEHCSLKAGALLYWGTIGTALAVFVFFRRALAAVIWCCAVFWMILMSVLIYPMLMHRAYLPFLLLVYLGCLLPLRKNRGVNRVRIGRVVLGIVLCLLSAMTFPDTWRMTKMDFLHPFSNQEIMAYYIKNNVPAESRIITFPADLISSTLTAYLPDHHFYSCRTNQRYRVYTRKEGIPATLNDALLHYYAKSGEKVFYLLFCRSMIPFYRITPQKLASFRDFSLELLFYTDPPAFFPAGEDYLLFKVTAKE
ncbi:MAG: hypothetical protein J6S58_05685 [Lentisphaeria bacterium]|nr:hypothetical protein [Lentisphaeria bacterium]